MKRFLITGCGRSGTTFIGSMIGGHKDISVVDDSNYEVEMIGKPLQGYKTSIPVIRLNKSQSLFRRLVYHKTQFLFQLVYRVFGNFIIYEPHRACYSVNDFDTIIFISRDKEEVIKSMTNRVHVTRRIAEKIYNQSQKIKSQLKGNVLYINYSDVVNSPEREMKRICKFLELEYDPNMLKSAGYNNRYKNFKL